MRRKPHDDGSTTLLTDATVQTVGVAQTRRTYGNKPPSRCVRRPCDASGQDHRHGHHTDSRIAVRLRQRLRAQIHSEAEFVGTVNRGAVRTRRQIVRVREPATAPVGHGQPREQTRVDRSRRARRQIARLVVPPQRMARQRSNLCQQFVERAPSCSCRDGPPMQRQWAVLRIATAVPETAAWRTRVRTCRGNGHRPRLGIAADAREVVDEWSGRCCRWGTQHRTTARSRGNQGVLLRGMSAAISIAGMRRAPPSRHLMGLRSKGPGARELLGTDWLWKPQEFREAHSWR